ncbi:MAG: hypothetical protein AMXMBFR7_35220 [Planctomycetota bacterium]
MNAEPNPPPDFRQLFETSPGLYLILNPDFSIAAVSDAYLQATMTRREDLIGKNIFEAFPDNPDDAAADGVRNLRASLERVRATGTAHRMAVQRYDIRRPAEEGGQFEERYWSPLNSPVLGDRGQLVYITHDVKDVTERVRMEQEAARQDKVVKVLEASERKFRALLESAPDAIVISNRDGRIELVNSRTLELFGYSKEELIGREVEMLIPEPLREVHMAHRERYIQNPVSRTMGGDGAIKGRRKDGSLIPVETSVSPIETEDGLLIATNLRDITERLRQAEQVRQVQKMEAVGRLTGGVAHDFNNLLTIILGYGSLLLNRQDLPAAARNELQVMHKTAERAATLTRQLLQFSRQQVLQPKILNIGEYVQDMAAMLRRLLGESVELRLKLGAEPAFARLDPGQFQQVVLNLVINAKDAMPRGGIVTLEISKVDLGEEYTNLHPGVKPGAYLMLAISDTGVGMDEHTRTRIFEPFYTTKGVGAGTGLGLATVHGIVHQSGGHIWVYSEPGRGTTFKIYIPRTDEAGASEAPRLSTAQRKPCSETILVVEDEQEIVKLLQAILSGLGYNVLTAGDGEAALRLSEEFSGTIHLLLTDIVMPKMSGGELAQVLQTRRPGIRCLYMSGYTNDTIKLHGALDQGGYFIEKPFIAGEIALKVRECLDAAT